jgi:hypothetical protein
MSLKGRSTACAEKTTRWKLAQRRKCLAERKRSFVPLAVEHTITVSTSGAMISYDAGTTVSKSTCFPSVDKCDRIPATRNPFQIGQQFHCAVYSMSILARVIQPADAILCQNFL